MVSFDNLLGQICSSDETRFNILTDGQFTCSYSDVPARVEEIDHFLVRQGLGPGDCVAVECINSLAGALLLLALFRKGRSFVLTPHNGNADLKPTPNFCRYRVNVIPAGQGDLQQFLPSQFLQAVSNPSFNGKSTSGGKMFLRTSGSMGASKIVVHSHENLMSGAATCAEKYGFGPAERATIPVPVAHMYGFGAEFLPAVMSGTSIDLQEKTNLLKYLDREKRFQPTIVFATSTICEMLLKGYKNPRSNYKVFVTSGQRISEETFRAFDPMVSGRLINQYGSTEMGATAACDVSDSLDRRATTIGSPMRGVELRLDESEMPGRPYDLYCKHPFGFGGYVDEDGEWIQQASLDGWYRTGDLAVRHPDGSIAVVGRADASINRRGYLVLLSDIEQRMEKLPELSEVVVVAGNQENKQGQRLAAFCVPRKGAVLNGPDLRQQCFELLPHYAIPDEVYVREGLPLLPSGKVDRRTLAALVG